MMAKKKPIPPSHTSEETEELVKYSILIHSDLDAKILQICQQRRISKSVLFRELLEENLDNYLRHTPGQLPVAEGKISITLNPETLQLLTIAARDLNVSLESAIQLLVTRSLVSFVETSRADRERVAATLREATGQGNPEAGSGPATGTRNRSRKPSDQ